MKTLHRSLLIALVAVLLGGSVLIATAGSTRPSRPPAGLSYTPAELKALIAFSNMTFAQKQAYLASLP